MKPVKRVEIVIDSIGLNELTRALKQNGVAGYTVIPDVSGMGDRGPRMGDELTEVFKNCYVMIACSEEELGNLVEAIRPHLKKFGGICLVGDAQWIKH